MELALRFVLLRKISLEDLPAYGTALAEFLTDKMIEMADSKKFDRTKEEKAFKETFDRLSATLESDSFRKYEPAKDRFTGGFSVSAFEVIGLGIGWNYEQILGKYDGDDLVTKIKNEVWSDTSFLTSTGLAAASRLPKTLARGRSVFGG